MAVVKKAKRKMQHQEAIGGFKEWERTHPKATHKEKFEAFDAMVDSSELKELLDSATA